LDFVTNALVGFAAYPFGLGREWLVDVWGAVELEQAEFGGGEAFAGLIVLALTEIDGSVTKAARVGTVTIE
jgi:hypothetical protein